MSGLFVAMLSVGAAQAQQPELVAQHRSPDQHVTFSPDGRLYATIGECCGPVLIWDAATGRLVRELTNVGNAHRDVVFSPDGRLIGATPISFKQAVASRTWGDEVAVWRVSDGMRVAQPPPPAEVIAWGVASTYDAARRIASVSDSVRALMPLVSADGRTGVVVRGDWQHRLISVRSNESGVETDTLASYSNMFGMALSPNGRVLVVGGSRPTPGIDVWDLVGRQRVVTLDGAPAGAFAFSPDGRLLALGGERTVRLYRTDTWAVIRSFTIDVEAVTGVRELAFTHDSRRIAISGDDLRIIDLTTGVELPRPRSRITAIDAMAVSDSVIVVARSDQPRPQFATANGTVERWPFSGAPPRLVGSGLYPVTSLAVSADGHQVAAAMMAPTVWSRYTQAFEGGYWFLDGGASVTRTSRDIDEARNPVSDIARSTDGHSLLAVTYAPIPSTRTCPYVECGEDESTDYTVWLTRIDPWSGKEVHVRRIDRTTMDGARATLSPRGDYVLVRQGNAFRVLATTSGAPVASVVAPASTGTNDADTCGDDDTDVAPSDVFSPSGRLAMITHGAGGSVIRTLTGEVVRRVQLPHDSATTVLIAAHFASDSTIMLLACTRGARGRALLTLDLYTGLSREVARLADDVRDFQPLARGGVAVRTDDVIQLYSTAGELRASLLFGKGTEWLVVTPDGRYDASARGTELAAWRLGSTLTPVDRLAGARRVAGLLARLDR